MQKIRIDFDNPGLPQHISAVENDSQSRFFQATLYENGKAYTAPEGATYSIMYRGFGPQNQGWYDTINDGAGKRAACAVSGNVVTCEIARQALQVPGHVSIVLCVTAGKGYMLKSWPIECDCKNDSYDSTAEIQSFFYITQVSNADWTQAIQAWEDLKNTIDPTLSVSGKAADAAKVGEAVEQVEKDKIDNPSTDDDGKIPRARDGVVEWVEVGQPTDEQTESAVTKWLDKHPEATTTVQEGSIGLKQISDEMQSVIVGVNSGVDSVNYIDAIKKGYIDTFVCSENHKVYDFKNIIIKNLIVNCVSSIIKNVKVTASLKISDGSRNCTFSNMRNEITTESVVFGENTWAHKFLDCTFIGNGDTICFKQGLKKGDTLICSNCYFYKMRAIFKPDKHGFAIIEGGWGDSINYIIYADTFVNANYTINNYDFESIKNVLYTKGKASNFDLCINGVIATCDSIVLCDDPTNTSTVNLIYNCNLLPRFKLFDTNISTDFTFKTCNIVAENICNYPMGSLKKEITLELFIPPKCYYEPFKSIIHLHSASWDEKYDDAITVYFGRRQYAKNTIYNGVRKFGILNKTENPVYFTFTIDTKNNLIN